MGKKIVMIFAIAVGIMLWWIIPRPLMWNIDSAAVDRIEVIGGETGAGFAITERHDIEHIVNNIKSAKCRRDGLSIAYAGGGFDLSFFNINSKRIYKLQINTSSVINKTPFFYIDKNDSLCIDYLAELEKNIVNEEGYNFQPTD